MSIVFEVSIVLLSGVLLGLFYFYSLWLTIKQIPTTAYPIRLTIGSLLGRLAITLIGFYIIMDGQWYRALICLFGFIVGRTILTRTKGKIRKSEEVQLQN
ncbi:MAG: ATP synthase subunit I [Cyanobacteria bacterium SID2]|nr:ATP synthase subunit I [Cyanobacteria bacterium SID2]MBP0006080.1 ATP synthase subunit I [Cyanobacteria bacterium SBC]